MNRPPVNAPELLRVASWMVSSRWRNASRQGGGSSCVRDPREEQGLGAPLLWRRRLRVDLDVIDEVLTPDFVDHDRLPGQAPDREGYKRAIAEYHAAFSNVRFIVEDQVAEGDKVVTRFNVRATHDRRELHGCRAYRQGGDLQGHGHPPHRGGQDRRGVEPKGRTSTAVMEQRLEQERIERERIEQELRVARRIQQASLPKETPTLAGWQVSPFYQPAREVGGDFYDFHSN